MDADRDVPPMHVTARKVVDVSDPYLPGHFPGFPIYPGVFVIETVWQVAARALRDGARPLAQLASVLSARFSAPLVAGDVLTVDAIISGDPSGDRFVVDADCRRQDGAAAARVRLELSRSVPDA